MLCTASENQDTKKQILQFTTVVVFFFFTIYLKFVCKLLNIAKHATLRTELKAVHRVSTWHADKKTAHKTESEWQFY